MHNLTKSEFEKINFGSRYEKTMCLPFQDRNFRTITEFHRVCGCLHDLHHYLEELSKSKIAERFPGVQLLEHIKQRILEYDVHIHYN